MSITANITRQCKDLLGGIEIFYIVPWYKYSRSQIVVTGQKLTTFPTQTVYSVAAENVSFTENGTLKGVLRNGIKLLALICQKQR